VQGILAGHGQDDAWDEQRDDEQHHHGKPVDEGEQGVLVMTPLWSNTVTPFLRWLTGDIVTMRRQRGTGDAADRSVGVAPDQ